jgi:uncharacterized protein (TIGR02246 family)
MKFMMTVAMLALFATSAPAADAKSAPATPDDAITKACGAFFDAWNIHDVKTMTTFWADDATLINPLGRLAHGKADIEKLTTDEQTGVFKASTAKLVGVKVTRSLGSNMVFCDGEVIIDGAQAPDGSALPEMNFHMAMIMAKQGGHWVFAEGRPYAFLPPPPQPAKAN